MTRRRSAPTLVLGTGSQVRALAAPEAPHADAREHPAHALPDAAAIPRATTKRTRETLAK